MENLVKDTVQETVIAILKEYTLPQLRKLTIERYGKPLEEMSRMEIATHLAGENAKNVDNFAAGNFNRIDEVLNELRWNSDDTAELALYILNEHMQSVYFLFE